LKRVNVPFDCLQRLLGHGRICCVGRRFGPASRPEKIRRWARKIVSPRRPFSNWVTEIPATKFPA
jgi:hypothetical protein